MIVWFYDNSTTIINMIKICVMNLDSNMEKVIFQNWSAIELHPIFVKQNIQYLNLLSL